MKKILVFGGAGLVGSSFLEENKNNFDIKAPPVSEVDILKIDQIDKILDQENPEVVINFAAFTNVQEAEKEKNNKNGLVFQINSLGANNVAVSCKKTNTGLIHISTEYVFDGTKADSPYVESDKPNPVNWYGMTKLFAEQYVLESECKSTIVRICMPYSPAYQLKKDIARFFVEQLKSGKAIKAVEDQRITPILVLDIATALKVLIDSNSLGLYHVSSRDSVTPLEFAKTIAETFKLDYSLISSISLDGFNQNKNAKFLRYSWLNPAKFEKEFGDQILHTVEEGLVIFKEVIDSKAGN